MTACDGRYPLLFAEEQTHVTFARDNFEALKKENFILTIQRNVLNILLH